MARNEKTRWTGNTKNCNEKNNAAAVGDCLQLLWLGYAEKSKHALVTKLHSETVDEDSIND